MAKRHRETTYEGWMQQEGVPVVSGYGVTDVEGIEMGPWKRLGGRGAFIQLVGMEGLTGMYITEIPPGGALVPEKHLYDELVYILAGRGATEVWAGTYKERDTSPGRLGSFFEWQTGSLFAPPLNTYHRLLNGSGTEPVKFLGITSAPIVMDLFHNIPFVFNSDYVFDDRYDGRADYFKVGERRFVEKPGLPEMSNWIWETNFIPDVRGSSIDPYEAKGSGARFTGYEMSGNVLAGHLSEWPVGRYHKAHYHGGGAVLLIVRSQGYTLMWPQEAGIQPYKSGHSEEIVRVDWREGSVLSPPTGWFHQHFNTGQEAARQVALRYGSQKYGVQFHDVQSRNGVVVSVRKGGTLIDYEDEDPEIRRLYREELERNGVKYTMPAPPV